MEALRTYQVGEGGDGHKEPILTDIGRDRAVTVTKEYVGPSALWKANLLPHRVRFHDGWFWTTAVCHSRRDDGLAFRQRPDGNGIEARCHTGDCSPELAADALGGHAGWPIRISYEPLAKPVDGLWWIRHWPMWRIESYAAAALAFAAPLLLGHGVWAGYLAFLAFAVGSWLTSRHLTPRRSLRLRR